MDEIAVTISGMGGGFHFEVLDGNAVLEALAAFTTDCPRARLLKETACAVLETRLLVCIDDLPAKLASSARATDDGPGVEEVRLRLTGTTLSFLDARTSVAVEGWVWSWDSFGSVDFGVDAADTDAMEDFTVRIAGVGSLLFDVLDGSKLVEQVELFVKNIPTYTPAAARLPTGLGLASSPSWSPSPPQPREPTDPPEATFSM
jgi:hypothetical protein